MQKPEDLPATSADARLYDRLFLIADLCANCWGVRREEIERLTCPGEAQQLARMAAIAIARGLMRTRFERLALHFGGSAETSVAACNEVAERSERDYDFRIAMRFLQGACAAILGLG